MKFFWKPCITIHVCFRNDEDLQLNIIPSWFCILQSLKVMYFLENDLSQTNFICKKQTYKEVHFKKQNDILQFEVNIKVGVYLCDCEFNNGLWVCGRSAANTNIEFCRTLRSDHILGFVIIGLLKSVQKGFVFLLEVN